MTRSTWYGVMGGAVLALGAAAVSLAGVLTPGDGSAAEDRAVLVTTASPERGPGTFHRGYTRLVQTLPNASAGGESVSDSVVIGTVASVEKSSGFVQGPPAASADKSSVRRTFFDDPLASMRTLRVTIDVDEVLAGAEVTTLGFEWGLMGSSLQGDDTEAVRRALLDLGTVAVMSRAPLHSGSRSLGIDRKLFDPPFNLAVANTDGSLSFPLIEDARTADTFMDGVDTLDELRDEAKKPAWTWRWPE